MQGIYQAAPIGEYYIYASFFCVHDHVFFVFCGYIVFAWAIVVLCSFFRSASECDFKVLEFFGCCLSKGRVEFVLPAKPCEAWQPNKVKVVRQKGRCNISPVN